MSVLLALLCPLQARAAIVFDGEGHASASKVHSLTLPAPGGVSTGDLMVASVAVGGAHVAVSAQGWTPIRTTTAGAALQEFSFYRFATASEPTSYTFGAPSGSNDISGGIAAYSGVDAASPVDAISDATGPAGSAVPSVTTSAPDDLVIGAVALGSTTTVTLDSSVTQRYGAALATSQMLVGDFVQTGPGATATKTASASGPAGERSAQAIALRPAPATSGATPAGSASATNPISTPVGLLPTGGWKLASGQPLTAAVIATLPRLSTDTHPEISVTRDVPVRISCPLAAVRCDGTIGLGGPTTASAKLVAARRRKIVREGRRFRVAAGKTATVRIRLDRRTVRRFANRRRVRARLRVTAKTSAGPAVKSTVVILRARRTARSFGHPRARRRRS